MEGRRANKKSDQIKNLQIPKTEEPQFTAPRSQTMVEKIQSNFGSNNFNRRSRFDKFGLSFLDSLQQIFPSARNRTKTPDQFGHLEQLNGKNKETFDEISEEPNYYIDELVITRACTLSLLLVIIIVFVIYLNYLLLGQFFFCLFLAQITSTSLRPYKDLLIDYCSQAVTNTEFLLSKSYIYLILKEILIYVIFIFKHKSIIKGFIRMIKKLMVAVKKRFEQRQIEQVTIFNDLWSIVMIILIYIGVTKIEIKMSLKIFIYYQVIDFAIKLILTILIWVIKNIQIPRIVKPDEKKTESFKQSIKQTLVLQVPTIIVTVYGVILLTIIVLFCLLIKGDIIQLQEQLYNKFGIQGLLTQYNISQFDQHFNQYAQKSLDYLQTQTNISLHLNISNSSMQDIAHFVHNIVMDPQTINAEIPYEWNLTLQHNTEVMDQSSISHFIPRYLKPYIVLGMSLLQHYDISQIANQIMNYFLKINSSVVSLFIFSFSSIFAWLLSIGNFAFNVFLYFTIVTYFLHDGNDLIQSLFKVIPVNSDFKGNIMTSLNQSIKGVFLSNLQLATYQALYTWIIFDFYQIKYLYIYSMIAAFFKIVPIFSTFLIGIIGAAHMYFQNGYAVIHCILEILIYLFVDYKLSTDIYEREVQAAKPYLMGMSVFMGYYAFDLQGIFYGPLLICSIKIVYDLFSNLSSKNQIGVDNVDIDILDEKQGNPKQPKQAKKTKHKKN